MKNILRSPVLRATLAVALTCATAHAANVKFADFIDDASRVGFMGFEGLPATDYASGAAITHEEDGILIEQVNGQPNDIWTTYFTPEGDRGWYPNAGDFGYTKLTLASGVDFRNVGFLLGSGQVLGPAFATYALFNDGVLVLTGTLALSSTPFYLGFSGGGFDEVRLRDHLDVPNLNFLDGTENGLAIDAIEISVPDHDASSAAMVAGVLSALALFNRRRPRAVLKR